jgi:hypothetical protein
MAQVTGPSASKLRTWPRCTSRTASSPTTIIAVIYNGGYIGIKFEPSANAQLFVVKSIIGDNGNNGGATGGIYIVPASGMTATVSIDRSQIDGNIFGIVADGTQSGSVNGNNGSFTGTVGLQ